MSEAVVEPTVVILPGRVWREELEVELVRAGLSAEQAPRAAAHALHRIVGHAGYRRAFLIGDESDDGEEAAP